MQGRCASTREWGCTSPVRWVIGNAGELSGWYACAQHVHQVLDHYITVFPAQITTYEKKED